MTASVEKLANGQEAHLGSGTSLPLLRHHILLPTLKKHVSIGVFVLAVGFLTALAPKYAVAGTLALVFVLMSLAWPEVPLGIQLNGVIMYFLLQTRLGITTSPRLTLAFHASLILLYFVGYGLVMARKERPRISLSALHVWFALFALWAVVNWFFLKDSAYSDKKLGYLGIMTICPFVAGCLASHVGNVRRLYWVMIACALVTSGLSTGLLLLGDTTWSYGRLASFGEHSGMILSNAMSIGALGLLTLKFGRPGLLRNLFWTALMVLMAYTAVLTGMRSCLFAFILAAVGTLLFLSDIPLWKRCLVVTAGLALVAAFALSAPVRDRFMELAGRFISTFSSVSHRFMMFKQASDEFLSHPVAGIGLGNFRDLTGYGLGATVWRGSTFPHNAVLEVACELGIIGLIPFVAILLLTAGNLLKALRRIGPGHPQRDLVTFAAAMFAYCFLMEMANGPIYVDSSFWVAVGLLHKLSAEESNFEVAIRRNE